MTEEDAAQVERLRYLLENSCKEGLVDSPIHWPGVHCAKALITGGWAGELVRPEARAQRPPAGQGAGAAGIREPGEVVLSQLPCWRQLSPEAYRSRIAELVRQIEETAAAVRQETGREPLGEEGVRAQDLETPPHLARERSNIPDVGSRLRLARRRIS